MTYLHSLPLMILTLCLTACASFYDIKPGQTGSEVIAQRGTPTRIWPEPDGGRTLEYSTQPLGTTNYMVRMGADDRVLSAENALAPAGLDRVKAGMTREEIEHMLGTPRSRTTFKLSKEEVWDWTIPNLYSGDIVLFNVHFLDGRMVRTSTSRIPPGDMFRGG